MTIKQICTACVVSLSLFSVPVSAADPIAVANETLRACFTELSGAQLSIWQNISSYTGQACTLYTKYVVKNNDPEGYASALNALSAKLDALIGSIESNANSHFDAKQCSSFNPSYDWVTFDRIGFNPGDSGNPFTFQYLCGSNLT